MRDLVTELRDYVDSIDEPFEPATLIEKADRVTVDPPSRQPSWRRGIAIGVAAAIIVLVLVGGALLVGGPIGGDKMPVVTQPTPRTTVTQPPPETTEPSPPSTTVTTTARVFFDSDEWLNEDGPTALARLDDFYSAVNAGDFETAFAVVDLPKLSPRLNSGQLAVYSQGVGAHISHSCSLSETERVVTCTETVTDDLYGPAGIDHQAGEAYVVRGDTIMAYSAMPSSFLFCTEPPGAALEFLLEFHQWAVTTHPELEANWWWGVDDTKSSIPCTPYPFHTPEDAAEICDVVAEFVEQSDRWPDNT